MKIRSFIAADPPPEILKSISIFLKGHTAAVKGIQWMEPEAIHLTLRFLGGVEEETIEEIKRRLSPLSGKFPPIHLGARGIGVFPNERRPRIVWVGLEGEIEQLANLQKGVVEAIQALPVKPEENRAFRPHLTIGRIKDAREVRGLEGFLETRRSTNFGEFVINQILLLKSDLTPQGARYTKLGSYETKGGSHHGAS